MIFNSRPIDIWLGAVLAGLMLFWLVHIRFFSWLYWKIELGRHSLGL